MPKKVAHNCFQCSKLSHDAAQAKSCWDADRCPNRRHYQRNKDRISQQRKKQRIETVHQISVPEVVYGVLLVWREPRQDSPIHAIGADIWDGEQRLAVVTPVHCAGWLPSQVHSYIQQTLNILENAYGFQKFASQITAHPEQCPIRPCPLCASALPVGSVGRSD